MVLLFFASARKGFAKAILRHKMETLLHRFLLHDGLHLSISIDGTFLLKPSRKSLNLSHGGVAGLFLPAVLLPVRPVSLTHEHVHIICSLKFVDFILLLGAVPAPLRADGDVLFGHVLLGRVWFMYGPTKK